MTTMLALTALSAFAEAQLDGLRFLLLVAYLLTFAVCSATALWQLRGLPSELSGLLSWPHRVRTLSRLPLLCGLSLFLFGGTAAGQNMSGMPDYGSYVHTGNIDVYSPLDGQISINLPFSSHSYRGFTDQFGFRYNSNIWQLSTNLEPCSYTPTYHENCALSRWIPGGGWQASNSQGGVLKYSDTEFVCSSIFGPESQYYNVRAHYAVRANYIFQDFASGRIYQFPVRKYKNLTPNLICPEIGGASDVLVAPSDEGGMQLDIRDDVPGGNMGGSATFKITTKDGTTITSWRANGKQLAQIKDTNGNTLTYDGSSNNNGLLPTPTEDPLCTPLPQIGLNGTQSYTQFFCYVDSNGVTQNVRVDWTRITIHPAFPTTVSPTWGYDNFFQNGDYSVNVISSITLPNNLAYTFSYDPVFGVLSKVTLPTGGYIRYTWAPIAQRKAIPNPGLLTYVDQAEDVLVLTARYVSGDGVNELPPTRYSYFGTWNTGWTTTVTDPLGNQEVHTFPGAGDATGIALESQAQYLDAGGRLLKQEDKNWGATGGPVQLGFALASAQDNVGTTTMFPGGDSPIPSPGLLSMLGWVWDDGGATACSPVGIPVCLHEAVTLASMVSSLLPSSHSHIAVSPSVPGANGSVVYNGARNIVLLSQTTTLYNDDGSHTTTTTQTDYNDCSTFMNFDPYSGTGINPASFLDCRDNPTQIREYGYDLAANNAGTNFNGHAATSAAPASRYTDFSYWHQSNSGFGPAGYAVDTSNGGFLYNTTGSHILDLVADKKVYDGVGTTGSSPASRSQSTYDTHGNALTKSAWLNTSNSWITSSFTYDSYGHVLTSTDPLGRVTTFDYTDNYTDATKNTGTARFVTKTTLPTTTDAQGVPHQHIKRAQYDWNTGLAMAACGENYTGSACTAGQSSTSGPIPDYSTHTFDLMNRPLTVADGAGGLTSFVYSEASLPITLSMTTKHDASTNVVHKELLDGLGRTKQTQSLAPECTIKTDTTYDALSRISTVSNPYCATTDTTYGITTTQYDALSRVVKVIPPDGTASSNNVTTDYSSFPTITVIDQAGKQRRTRSDGLGRLAEVDEPGNPTAGAIASGSLGVNGPLRSALVGGHPATQATGSLTITGTDSITWYTGDPVCVMYGDEGCLQWQTPWYPICDGGEVKLTLGGHPDSTIYACGSDATSVANGLASAINNDGAALVTAGVSNATPTSATVNLTSRAYGNAANYSWSLSASTSVPEYFSQSSFSGSPLSSSLSGGTDAFGGNTVYDSGSAKLTVGSFSSPAVPYSSTQNSTAAALSGALAQAFTNAPGSPATATASGATINLTYRSLGQSGNVAASVSSTPDNATLFPGGSFSGSGALGNGVDPDPTGINHPNVTLYSYDTLNNLLCVEQHGNVTGTGCSASPSNDATSPWRVRRFTYNSLSQLLTAKNPESGTITYGYDPSGNVLQKTSPAANQAGSATQTISYCYDELKRITGKAYSAQNCTNGRLPSGTAVVSYFYDQASYQNLATANGSGRLTGISDQAGTGAYSFDATGQIVAEQRSIAGQTKSMSYEYNPDGSLSMLHYPSGAVVAYAADSAGRTVSAIDSGHGINYVTGATYAPSGALTRFVSGGAITNSFSYNKRLQPVFMSASTPSQSVFSIGYDFHLGAGNNGNVFAILNNRDHNRDQTFTYDALNRLISAQNAGTDCTQHTVNGKTEYWGNSYGYDAWGNLLQKTITKCGAENMGATADARNWIHAPSGADYQYDAAGNMTYDASGQYYSYDQEYRITGAGGYTYTYDADGNRVKKSNGSTGTLYWYMSPGIVAESDLNGTLQSEYVFFGGERVARRDGVNGAGGVFYYFSDHLKTASVITDSTGVIKAESDYYPWGGELQFVNNDSNHYKFTGKERDAETGLDYFGARYYSNGLGRWVSADWSPTPVPIPYADLGDPQSLNLYSYVRNVPTTGFDGDGHWPRLLQADWTRVGEVGKQFAKDLGIAAYNATADLLNNTHESRLNVLHYIIPDVPKIPTNSTVSGTTANVVVGAIPLVAFPEGGEARALEAVEAYEVGTYGELRARSVVGDGLSIDHIPSNASNIARKEAELGRELTAAEKTAVRDQGMAVANPDSLHRSASPTYGGRNTPQQIAADAANPQAAAARDTQAMVDAASSANKTKAQAAAAKICRAAECK
jgi:RHS repeat-associated protein